MKKASKNEMASDDEALKRIGRTSEMEAALLQGLLDSKNLGKDNEGGFKPEGWSTAIRAVKEVTGEKITKQQAKTKRDGYKGWYSERCKLLNNFGFGRDPDTARVVAEPDV